MFRRSLVLLGAALVMYPAFAIDPLNDPITPDRPLFIFQAPGPEAGDTLAHADTILAAWQQIPDSIRPYAALQLESPITDEAFWPDRFIDVVQELQYASIPLFISIANGDDPRAIYPITELGQLLERFTVIRGVHVRGLQFNEYFTFGEQVPEGAPAQVRWLTAAIGQAVRYGRLISIELDEVHWLRIMSNTWCRPLYDTIQNNKAHVIAMNGQRGAQNITRSSALMGMWIEGAVDQWGLRCSSDWSQSAGFIEPGVYGVAGDEALMPPAPYRAMILNGAMTGAAVYRFDRAADLWFGPRRHYWDEAIFPTLNEIVDRGYIVRKDQALRKARVAYRMNPSATAAGFHANLADLDALYDEGRLLRGAYGMDRPGQVPELVLNTGRYYWIPVLSPYALDETLRQFDEVILPGAMLDAPSWTQRLDFYYPATGGGAAFVCNVGRGVFVMHTRENRFEEQAFTAQQLPTPVRGVTARRAAEGVELTWPFREGDLYYKIFRRILPETEFEMIASDVDARRYLDQTPLGNVSVVYAVTALTNEREPYSGTVNFGDYLIFNAAESRIDEEVLLDDFTSSATSKPILPIADQRPASQEWWPSGLDGLRANEAEAARAIVARIEAMDGAYVQGNLDGLVDLYAETYRDAAGWGREYVRAAYDLFLKQYQTGQMHRQIRAWDFAAFAGEARVSVLLYCAFTGLDLEGPSGRYADLPVSFPDTPTGEVRMTFVEEQGTWRLVSTDPPLPLMEDMLDDRAFDPPAQPIGP